MNEPRRLLDDDATAFERAMLEEARAIEPTQESMEKTLLALGVVGTGVAATTTLATAGSSAKVGIGFLATKWVLFALACGLVAAMVHTELDRGRRPRAPAAIPSAAATGLSTLSNDVVATAPSPSASSPTVPVPVITESSTPRAETVRPSPSPSTPRISLQAETALLDAARSSLVAGDPARALATLDRYDSEFAGGQLTQEAARIRVQALSAAGDHQAADEAARRFLEKNPESPHAPKVRALGDDAP